MQHTQQTLGEDKASLRRVKSAASGGSLISALSQPNLAASDGSNNQKNGQFSSDTTQPVRSSKAHFAALHGMNIPFSGSATVQGHMLSRMSSLPVSTQSQFPQLSSSFMGRPPSTGATLGKRMSREDVDAYGNVTPR